jgi:ABC-type hemin transport system ATPase subunit
MRCSRCTAARVQRCARSDGVDFDARGKIRVLRPNGSGKSAINVVSGHYRADAGSMRFAGADIARWRAHAIARAASPELPDPASVRALVRAR